MIWILGALGLIIVALLVVLVVVLMVLSNALKMPGWP